ncbi:DUF4124 domain-containing protein [Pseudomonas cavernae]|uniref:DUF4124 domain-containing protein n=1 Tax=Pseudomonas cavernae TaxID=2320867 RepID=A0A385Z908_9PSED|nr:DUF4124 domain-containing protein [Pseudomonas cavernae]AYC34657.1 DUF4124 domain-containing protein [Pseudomonas cavernae]
MRLTLFCLLLLGLPAMAEVYTYLDAEGNRVFTDRPHPGNAQRLQLTPANSMGGQRPNAAPPAPAPAAPVTVPSYQLLRILVPEPDATIQNGTSGDLIVTATSEPGLLPGHNYQVLLDGRPASEPSRSPVFPLSNLERGSHQLAVEIRDAEGRTLERTPNQPVHILRASLAQKRRIKPCKHEDYGARPECRLQDKPAEEPDIPLVPFM